MATNIKTHRKHFTGRGAPSPTDVFTDLKNNDTYVDLDSNTVYRFSTTGWVSDINNIFGNIKGDTGAQGIPGETPFEAATAVTGAAGTQANAEIIQLPESIKVLKLTIPRGDTGAQGIPGPVGPQGVQGIPGTSGSGSVAGIVTPDQFGAVHANRTFAQAGFTQATIDANFPGIGATTSDQMDWACWQKAINEGCATGKQVIGWGEYFINRTINLPKYFATLYVNGGNCYIQTTVNGTWPLIGRPAPTDNGDANIMIQAYVTMHNLRLGVKGGQFNNVGIAVGPTYGSEYNNIKFYNINTGLHLRFALNTMVTNGEALNCIKGWIADIGNWAGAGNANSQSNHSSFDHCRFYADSNSICAFEGMACSGFVVKNSIIEGLQVQNGINIDGMGSTVVKDATIENVHFECVNGATGAFIKARLLGGIVTLNKAFGQYAALLMDAGTSAGGGYTSISISNIPYWVPKNGIYFNNAGSTSWKLDWNDNMFGDVASVPSKFSGTAVSVAPVGTMNNGNNKVNVANIIPR